MHVELIGCTGAGKSTLARSILQGCGRRGIPLVASDEFVLRRGHLNWVPGRMARTLALDLCALYACLATWRKHRALYTLAVRTVFRSPTRWYHKLNLLRNALKKIGIYELIRRGRSDEQLVLVDEGTVHMAHNLFVHDGGQTDAAAWATFLRAVPLPDVVVLVEQPEPVLVARTLARGHKRIPQASRATVQAFIRSAVEVFHRLAREPAIAERLLVLDDRGELVASPPASAPPAVIAAREIMPVGSESQPTTASGPPAMIAAREIMPVGSESQPTTASAPPAVIAVREIMPVGSESQPTTATRPPAVIAVREILGAAAACQPPFAQPNLPAEQESSMSLCPEVLGPSRTVSELRKRGAIIAVVGADGTGKSTILSHCGRWLGAAFDVTLVHAGKPPATWLTLPFTAALLLLRRVNRRSPGAGREAPLAAGGAGPSAGKPGWVSLPYALRAVVLAWERRQLLVRCGRLAAQGRLVLCDRYPSDTLGAMDSPRLRLDPGRRGLMAAIGNGLARIEARLYRQIPPPDVVLRMRVSVETAKRRNRERDPAQRDDEAYLERRHDQQVAWERSGTRYVCDVDADGTLADTVRMAKAAVWQSLEGLAPETEEPLPIYPAAMGGALPTDQPRHGAPLDRGAVRSPSS